MTPENVQLMHLLRRKKAEKLAKRERDAARFRIFVYGGLGLFAVIAVTAAALLSPQSPLPVATAANTAR